MREPINARQRGAALLLSLLALLVVSSTVMLARANSRLGSINDNPVTTGNALAMAKEALIARAVSDGDRPGELPCPDFNNDGQISPIDDYAGANCRARLGWLPYAHLGLPEMLDGSSSRIWYAVSNGHAALSTRPPLNSDVAGGLSVDSSGDVVAVLIAPGTPYGSQDRLSAPSDATAARGLYLEGSNADGDDAYTRAAGGDFNDRVLTITRRDLMYRVERRVASELAATLKDYYLRLASVWLKEPNFPWLKAFSDPSTTVIYAHDPAGISEGQIALHTTEAGGDVDGIEGGFTLNWSGISGATLTLPGGPSSMDGSDLTDEPAGGLAVPESDGSCSWHVTNGAARAPCVATTSITYPHVGRMVGGRTIVSGTRTYTLIVDIQNNSLQEPSDVTSPTAAPVRPRTRSVTADFIHLLSIGITDAVNFNVGAPQVYNGDLLWSAGASGTISVTGIYYRLDPLIELPVWFEPNGWHTLAYAVLAPSHQAGGDDDCTDGVRDCVIVTVGGVDQAGDVVAAGIIGGSALTPPRTTHTIGDYFELQNAATGDGRRAARGRFAAGFNDHLKALYQSAGVDPVVF